MAGTILALGSVLLGLALLIVALLVTREERRQSSQRLNLINEVQPVSVQAAAAAARLRGRRFDEPLQRFFSFGIRRRWGANISGVTLLVWAAASAGGVFFVVFSVLHLGLIAFLPAAAVFLAVPNLLLRMEQTRTEVRFMAVFPDAVDTIIRLLRAGLPISAAIRVVGTEGSPPLNKTFADLADQIEIGASLPEALAAMGARIGLPDVRFFAVAVSLQHGTGGNLAATLDILSDIVRKRAAMRLKTKAVTAEVRMSAYILAAIPLVVVGGLLIIQPNYLAVLITDRRGNIIVLAAALSLTTGLLIMRSMMRRLSRF
jgi:tight adherence protein B